ncbi:MAG: DeoR/GlpR family DNA-binding transcription regulator [Deinococcota bacterium]|nr:DeoR/GlpR family DNA-binding transcription regulator [Deinococcota bacterium]
MMVKIDFVPLERHQAILQQALSRRVVRVKELAESFDVHEMTVRRDLDALTEQGLLERIHGGARLKQQASDEVGYHLRASSHTEAKERIARNALELVQDKDTVAIDASTTGLALARLLGGKAVTAIVTGLDAANVLSATGTPYMLVGGNFHAPARSYVGSLTSAVLTRLHPDRVFFSAKGFTPQAGFTDAHLPEVEVKEKLIASAGVVIALLDHSKFGRTALGTIATAREVDILVTDRAPEASVAEALEAAGTRLIVAGEA